MKITLNNVSHVNTLAIQMSTWIHKYIIDHCCYKWLDAYLLTLCTRTLWLLENCRPFPNKRLFAPVQCTCRNILHRKFLWSWWQRQLQRWEQKFIFYRSWMLLYLLIFIVPSRINSKFHSKVECFSTFDWYLTTRCRLKSK